MRTTPRRGVGARRISGIAAIGCCDGSRRGPAEMFRVLADPNRVALLERLIASCPEMQSVSDLAPFCPVDFSVVSRHLRQLREAGIVETQKVGKHVFYRVRAREVASVLRRLADALETCCRDAPPARLVPRLPTRARRQARGE